MRKTSTAWTRPFSCTPHISLETGKIKPLAKNSPILGDSKCQITLSRSTYIKPTTKDEEISLDNIYQLTPFVQCQQLVDSANHHINLLCGVVHVFPPDFIQKINKHVQNFVVVNEESRSTILTLWEEFMHSEGLLLSESVHSDLNVILALLASYPTRVWDHCSMGKLKDNIAYVGRTVSEKLYNKAHQSKDKPLDTQIRKISQILSLPETVKSFWVKSTLQVTKPGQPFYFLGCSGCSGPCGAVYGTEFMCYYCNKQFPSPNPILRFEVELYDGTGCLDAYVEHTEAQLLLQMSSEVVVTAETKGTMPSLDEINDKFRDMLFFFHIQESTNPYKGKMYTRNTVMTCISESCQPSPPHLAEQKTPLTSAHKRLMSDISAAESQQSTSVVQDALPPEDILEHQQDTHGIRHAKHARQI